MSAAHARRAWRAGVLSLFVPGLGDLYAGFPRPAVALLLFFPAVDMVAGALLLRIPVPVANVALPLALTFVARAAVAVASFRRTRRRDPARPVQWWSRWYSCVLAALLVSAIVLPAWARLIRATVVHAYAFPTGSMEDTILNGDRVLVDTQAYRWGRKPRRGDLAVFPYPEDPARDFLKRVIGLPGETVEIRGKTVLVGGSPLAEGYATFLEPITEDDLRGRREDWGPVRVPAGQYFVLGDNRDNSKDSRHFGFVDGNTMTGRAGVVYWSQDPRTKDVRWDRIGLRLR